MIDRATFLRGAMAAAIGACASPPLAAVVRRHDFWFTRLRYRSGDWDVDQRFPSNLLNSLIEYTGLKVDPTEHVADLAEDKVIAGPFCYLAGHKLLEFTPAERRSFERYVRNGGFVLVDDCNHDVDGLFARSFEKEVATIFGPQALQPVGKGDPLYNSFFRFADGPPATSFELNGWGDDMIHPEMKAVRIRGRIGILYSNKDYGCEWDYDWRNKRFMADDNTKLAVNIAVYAITS